MLIHVQMGTVFPHSVQREGSSFFSVWLQMWYAPLLLEPSDSSPTPARSWCWGKNAEVSLLRCRKDGLALSKISCDESSRNALMDLSERINATRPHGTLVTPPVDVLSMNVLSSEGSVSTYFRIGRIVSLNSRCWLWPLKPIMTRDPFPLIWPCVLTIVTGQT